MTHASKLKGLNLWRNPNSKNFLGPASSANPEILFSVGISMPTFVIACAKIFLSFTSSVNSSLLAHVFNYVPLV